jgi:hypothetical protein
MRGEHTPCQIDPGGADMHARTRGAETESRGECEGSGGTSARAPLSHWQRCCGLGFGGRECISVYFNNQDRSPEPYIDG